MHQKKNSKTPLIVYYIISLVVVLLLNTLLFPSIERYSVKEVEYSEFLMMLGEVFLAHRVQLIEAYFAIFEGYVTPYNDMFE